MSNKLKSKKIACMISVIGLAIAAISLLYCQLNGIKLWPSITIFCSMTAIFCATLSIYTKQKKVDRDSKK